MPNSAAGNASILRRLGEAGLAAHRAHIAAKKRRARFRKKLAREGQPMPTDPALARRAHLGHPLDCDCYDCLWGGETERAPRILPWPDRVRL